jgi:predicted enzyme related to lactoylglutathione lyase
MKMTDRKIIPGKFVWFELATNDAKKAQSFYGEALGWKTAPFQLGSASYDMILTGTTMDTMIGGYVAPRGNQRSHWISYVSVHDVDKAGQLATANGGKVIEPPSDMPTIGRRARIADPLGTEICLFHNVNGDPPDQPATQGRFIWNELHTPKPAEALTFYQKVLGFAHRSVAMGPSGTYHILSQGGVDRGGCIDHLPAGVPPSWLPYVYVDDVDATLARAARLGATIVVAAEDIPGVGRLGVFKDPVGAVLAIMKPNPR